MNRLSTTERAAIVRALVEGNSIRATCRLTGAAKGTVLRLLSEVGTACADYQDAVLRHLPCKRLQCDEIWSFCYAKDRNVVYAKKAPEGAGDVWTWVAICRDTKLVPTWLVGQHSPEDAYRFMADLASRMDGRIHLTTDGHGLYIDAVGAAFDGKVDFAQLVKTYSAATVEGQRRYSPARFVSAEKKVIFGDPVRRDVSTSHVERQNLTLRMSSRRFTRLTNGFSNKLTNLEAAVALHFAYYNFCRKHQTIGTAPAVAAGVCRHPLTTEDLVALLDDPYRAVA